MCSRYGSNVQTHEFQSFPSQECIVNTPNFADTSKKHLCYSCLFSTQGFMTQPFYSLSLTGSTNLNFLHLFHIESAYTPRRTYYLGQRINKINPKFVLLKDELPYYKCINKIRDGGRIVRKAFIHPRVYWIFFDCVTVRRNVPIL